MTDSNPVTTASPAPARILIADNEQERRLVLHTELSGYGYDVIAEASSGRQAVDLAHRLQPDLAILDADMDQLDGLNAAAAIIRADLAPVILLATDDVRVEHVIREVKVSGFVPRPLCEGVLMPVIEIALAQYQDNRALREKVAELEDALETRKAVERAKGILMDLHGLSESDAFRRMRKTSMDNRKTMKEVAEAILLSHDLQLGNDTI